jgi:hypothetical protein
MADTRLFRLTYNDGSTRYGGRRKTANAASMAKAGASWFLTVTAIAATNAEATAGWTDVTNEFLGEK